MSCKAVKVVVRPSPPVKVVVEKKVQLPPVRVQVPGIQGAKTARVHSASSVKAKMLVEFIALIIRQRIYCLLKDEMLKLNVRKNYMTVPAAIKELDKIELVRINQGRYQLDHAITKNQEEILRAFGLTKNHVMARASSISEMIASSENISFTEETDDDEEGSDEDLYMTEVYDAEE